MAYKLTTLLDVDLGGVLNTANKRVYQHKIVSTLLTGIPAIQTIGDPVIRFDIKYSAKGADKDALDTLCCTGEEFKLLRHSSIYRGFIEESEIKWNPLFYDEGKDWSEGTFTFLVTETLV